ncbi:hypothetical protein KEM54_002275 [Ascosphaera aggregata]|nr:hypothetical protein KEM54_002275 [Ascosphaera aggregata]
MGPTTRANNRQPPSAPTFGSGSSRPRRNSDTSIMERERAPQKFERMNVDDERRRRAVDRDRRLREMSHKGTDREHSYQYRERKDSRDHERGRSDRHRRHEGERSRRDKGDEKDGRRRGKSTKPNRKLDVIDKLDLTGIYGPGQFHHDGPFDACNPHRNRKGIRAAPMQAFAEDSPSMVPTGGGPRAFDHDLYLGKGEDPYNDFSRTAIKQAVHTNNSQPKPDVATYDPKGKIEPVHGEETMGLGTSTFLDGAPASRAAIQEKQRGRSVDEMYAGLPGASEGSVGGGGGSGGLTRKKSLAQRIKLGGHSHSREKTLTDRPLRVASPEQLEDGPGKLKGSLQNGARVGGGGGTGPGSPGFHPHHATSASYDSYDRSSSDRDGKTSKPRSKTIDPTSSTDGDEVDDFGRPILGRRGSDNWTAGHGNRYGSGSGSGSGSGGGLLGRMKSLRKR